MNEESTPDTEEKKSPAKSALVAVLGLASAIWLVNPIDPGDALPVLGQIDEVAATALLLSCLSYFGLNTQRWTQLFGAGQAKREETDAKPVDGKVVND